MSYLTAARVVYLVVGCIWDEPSTRLAPLIAGVLVSLFCCLRLVCLPLVLSVSQLTAATEIIFQVFMNNIVRLTGDDKHIYTETEGRL